MNNLKEELTELTSILRDDQKDTSYKLALVRSVSSIASSFPLNSEDEPVFIPYSLIAQYFVAYYWSFISDNFHPYELDSDLIRSLGWSDLGILQSTSRQFTSRNQDIHFRKKLHQLKNALTEDFAEFKLQLGGHAFISRMKTRKKRKNSFDEDIRELYESLISTLCQSRNAIGKPIHRAGDEYFSSTKLADTRDSNFILPSLEICNREKALKLSSDQWEMFKTYSFYINSVCIQEWALYTEQCYDRNKVQAEPINRGAVFEILTNEFTKQAERQTNWLRRRLKAPVSNGELKCVWCGKSLDAKNFEIDHIIPLSEEPIHELWNLAPCHPDENSDKRAKLPSSSILDSQSDLLKQLFGFYLNDQKDSQQSLSEILKDDIQFRFQNISNDPASIFNNLKRVVTELIKHRQCNTWP